MREFGIRTTGEGRCFLPARPACRACRFAAVGTSVPKSVGGRGFAGGGRVRRIRRREFSR